MFLVAVYRVLCLSESFECVCVPMSVYDSFFIQHQMLVTHGLDDSISALYIQAPGHTDVHVQADRQTQWMD